jgi:hypothetical protein
VRQILVLGEKKFKLSIPDDAELTFGPWSPPKNDERQAWAQDAKRGTLRVYTAKKKDILAVFSGVAGFRDLSIGYAEEALVQKGETIWHDDDQGYHRESKSHGEKKWTVPELPE